MRQNAIGALVVCQVLLLMGCQTMAHAPPSPMVEASNVYVPVSMAFDVMPGYRDSLYFDVGDDSEFEFAVRLERANPSQKWFPTMFIELADESSNWAYNYNISLDMTLMKLWGHAREFDIKGKKAVADRKFPQLYDLDHEIHLRGKFEGRKLSIFLDDQLADTVTLPFDQRQLKFGASSGQFQLRFIEERPAPAPN